MGSSANKLALVIGINYKGQNGELRGCITDTHKIINILKSKSEYKDSQIILLAHDTDLKPTKKNIIDMINKFANRANDENVKKL